MRPAASQMEGVCHCFEGHQAIIKISHLLSSSVLKTLTKEATDLAQNTIVGRVSISDERNCLLTVDGTKLTFKITSKELTRLCKCCSAGGQNKQERCFTAEALTALMSSQNMEEHQLYMKMEALLTLSPKFYSSSDLMYTSTVPQRGTENSEDDITWITVLSSITDSTDDTTTASLFPYVPTVEQHADEFDAVDLLTEEDFDFLIEYNDRIAFDVKNQVECLSTQMHFCCKKAKMM